jgi:hypothetical protein
MTATLAIDCTAGQAPTMTASFSVRITTAATDPSATLKPGGWGFDLFGGSGSIGCDVDGPYADPSTTVTPATVAVAPGDNQLVTFSFESRGGTCATRACTFCGGKIVNGQVVLEVTQSDPRYPTTKNSVIASLPAAPAQVTCVGR